MIQNSLKAVIAGNPIFQKDKFGNEHMFFPTKSGSIVHIAPHLGKIRLVAQDPYDNSYVTLNYAINNNCYYFCSYPNIVNQICEYNPITGETKFIEVFSKAGVGSRNGGFYGVINYDYEHYISFLSDDGHAWFTAFKNKGLYGCFRYNTITQQIDSISEFPDKEFSHIHGRGSIPAYYIESGTLTGVYAPYWYNNAFESIRSTILSEITANGLTFNEELLYIHYDDRETLSATRRVFAPINGTWKVIDIKTPSNYIDSQVSEKSSRSSAFSSNVWIDNIGGSVSKLTWIANTLEDNALITGMILPTYSSSYAYTMIRRVGRFTYLSNYLANKSYFFIFAIHPITGEAIYPYTFDKATSFLSNSSRLYLCNFKEEFGFSSTNERVVFVTNNLAQWGFYRPDTYEWQAYDVLNDPNDYIIAQITNDTTDVNGLGILFEGRWENGVDIVLNNQTWQTHNWDFKSAVNTTPIQEIDPNKNLADVTWEVIPDINKPNFTLTFKLLKLRTGFGIPTIAFGIADNRLLTFGSIYSGISLSNIINNDSIQRISYVADSPISYNGAVRISETLWIGYGYLGVNHFVTIQNDEIIIDRLGVGSVVEPTHVAVHNNYFIFVGQKVRESDIRGGGWFSANHLVNKTTHNLNSAMPDLINGQKATDLRNNYGLGQPGYTDMQVEAAIQAYITTYGVSRNDIIDDFFSGPEYRCCGIDVWGTKCVVSVNDQGHLALSGIRIETTPGSGVWLTSNSNRRYNWPIVLYFDKADILTLAPADWRIVELRINGKEGVLQLGQVLVTQSNICWFDGDTTTGANAKLYKVSKTDFDAALSGGILSDDKFTVVNIPDNLGDERFLHIGTHQSNFYKVMGDVIYFTTKTNNNAVYKLDTSTNSLTLFATLSNNSPKSIDIYNDDMYISCGTNIYIVNDYQTVSVPYTLI